MENLDDLKERINNACLAHFKKGVEELLPHAEFIKLRDFLVYAKNPADFTIEVLTFIENYKLSESKS